MNRWIEQFSDLYGTERPYTAPVIDKVPFMEIMEEIDDEPEFTEMEAVVARLSNNKALGRDTISTDLIKAGRQVLLSPLYSLFLKCWRESKVPQEIRPSLVTYTTCPLTAFLGHVHRMPIDRLPKQIMYGELTGGKRPVGRPKLRNKDVIKDYGIDPMH